MNGIITAASDCPAKMFACKPSGLVGKSVCALVDVFEGLKDNPARVKAVLEAMYARCGAGRDLMLGRQWVPGCHAPKLHALHQVQAVLHCAGSVVCQAQGEGARAMLRRCQDSLCGAPL